MSHFHSCANNCEWWWWLEALLKFTSFSMELHLFICLSTQTFFSWFIHSSYGICIPVVRLRYVQTKYWHCCIVWCMGTPRKKWGCLLRTLQIVHRHSGLVDVLHSGDDRRRIIELLVGSCMAWRKYSAGWDGRVPVSRLLINCLLYFLWNEND